jgi:hypothetical protein
VIGHETGVFDDRQEMINVEDTYDPAPLLAKQAVDAAKGNLIAKPGPIAGMIHIAGWPVTPDVGSGRIKERDHHFAEFGAATRASSS